MAKNENLHKAKTAKNDEFYTQLSDIEKEMVHYKDHFKGKTIYCNCDDARESNFFKFFSLNFEKLGLKKLITTGYKADGQGVALIYEGDKNGNRLPDTEEITIRPLQGNGDFRSGSPRADDRDFRGREQTMPFPAGRTASGGMRA